MWRREGGEYEGSKTGSRGEGGGAGGCEEELLVVCVEERTPSRGEGGGGRSV